MSLIQLCRVNDLENTTLSRLSDFLGKPLYKIDSSIRRTRAWGRLGSTQLTITQDLVNDTWTIGFHIFTADTSYRKNTNDVPFDIAVSWLELNADFIKENMK